MPKKISGYFIQINIQNQLAAAGSLFSVVRDMTEFARQRGEDTHIQESFRDIAQRLLGIAESLKDGASALGNKTLRSVVAITPLRENISKQFEISRLIFSIVQDISKFAKSDRPTRIFLRYSKSQQKN